MRKILLIAAIALLTGAAIMPVQAQQAADTQAASAATDQQKASPDAKDTAPRKKKEIVQPKRPPKPDHMTQAEKDRRAEFMARAKAHHQEFKNRVKTDSSTVQKKPMHQSKKEKMIPQAQ